MRSASLLARPAGLARRRALCTVTAARRSTGVWRGGGEGGGGGGRLRSFEEIPHTGNNGWLNLVKFWKEDRFRLLHKHMERTFNALGPIYRERLGNQNTVNILLPSDIGRLFQAEGLYPQRMILQPWATHREDRQHSKGVFLKNGDEWRSDRLLLNKEVMVSSAVQRFVPVMDTVARDFCHMLRQKVERHGDGKDRERSFTMDPSGDLLGFTLEASVSVLYGERIGVFSSNPPAESERFISAMKKVMSTTPPLLHLPIRLLLLVGSPLWTQHATAWDHIFADAESRIQKGYRCLASHHRPDATVPSLHDTGGVLGQLIGKGQLSSNLIKANITELMAGAVDTTAVPLQFALFELGRNPAVQEEARQQVAASWAQAGGDPHRALQGAPLLKAILKETLRLYPVGITIQRYPVKDIVIQNYVIPAGTMVQACLYPFGRSADVFDSPRAFDPGRWGGPRDGGPQGGTDPRGGFRFLSFGFGPRQCIGRRIAETEIKLLLMHILMNFRLSVPSSEDPSTMLTLILQPETPPRITFSLLSPLPTTSTHLPV